MTRAIRNKAATVLFALSIDTFICYLWLFYEYLSSRPPGPVPELGLIYPLNNHGFYVYLTDVESEGMALLFAAGFFGGLLGIIIVPKDIIDPDPLTPRWQR